MRGHAAGRSRTFPYEVSRVSPSWVMRDAPRKNPRDYRKEEWIAYDVDPEEADAIVRQTCARALLSVRNAGGGRAGSANASRLQGSRISAARDRRFLRAAAETDSTAAISRFDRTRAHIPLGGAVGEDHSHSANCRAICSGMTLRSASTWRSMERTSLGACAVCMRRERPGARTCMLIPRTGVAASVKAAVENVAGRPSLRLEVLGADRELHRGALVSSRGL